MKKNCYSILFLCFAACLLICLCVLPSFAIGNTFVVEGVCTDAYAGQEVAVTFAVKQNVGIAGINVWLDYPEALTLVKIENKMTALTYTAGKTLLWDGSDNTTYTGDLIVATFAVPSDATLRTEYTVKLRNVMCCDESLQEVAYTSSDAVITVVCAHNSTEVRNAKSATCTVKGYTGDTYCKICNQKIATGTDISVIAHTYNQQVATATYLKSAATCTAKAKYYYSCVCGAKGTSTFESGEKLAHTFTQKNTNSKYLASAATCTAKAQYYYSCTCGAKGTETFESGSLAAHTIVTDPAVPATTISSGLTEGSHCSFCGKVLVEQQVIAAKDATPVEADVEEGKATVESVDVNKAKESVVIDFSAEKDAVTEVVLDKKTVEAIKSFTTDKASTLDIILRAADVSLDAATVNTISSVNADTVSLTVDKAETKDLTEKQQTTLQNEQVSEVISINLTAGNTVIHDLGGGKIQVTVPFTPKEGTDVKDYIVMYVSEDGTTEIRTVVGTADGTLSFETSTCSTYAIVYRPPVKATVSLTNTDFNTAWGLDFTTEIKANQTSGTGASFTLMFDPLYVTLKSYKAANGVTVVKGENSLTVSTSNRVSNGSTLVTLTFTTSEYVTSGEHVYLSLKSGTNNTSSFGKLKIYEIGDVNMDGKVNMRDALMIKQAAVKMIKLTAVQMAYADVYVDSNANIRDALLISQSVVHMKVTLGDRVTLSFENGADTVLRSVHSGATLTSIPTLATGYKWSLSKSSMKLPNFVGITQNLVLYARKVS